MLCSYSGLLEVVENESTFPEFNWATTEPYLFIDIIREHYKEVHTREEEIFNCLAVNFNIVEPTKGPLLRLEVKTNQQRFTDFLIRTMCVIGKINIRNLADVIENVAESKFPYVEKLIDMLPDSKSVRITLLVYGTNPY